MRRQEGNLICVLVDYKLRSNYKNHRAYIRTGDGLLRSWVQSQR